MSLGPAQEDVHGPAARFSARVISGDGARQIEMLEATQSGL